jgi:hypothetical protein
MENPVELIPETRKEWVAPELKKIDVEQITAISTGGGPGDGSFTS